MCINLGKTQMDNSAGYSVEAAAENKTKMFEKVNFLNILNQGKQKYKMTPK